MKGDKGIYKLKGQTLIEERHNKREHNIAVAKRMLLEGKNIDAIKKELKVNNSTIYSYLRIYPNLNNSNEAFYKYIKRGIRRIDVLISGLETDLLKLKTEKKYFVSLIKGEEPLNKSRSKGETKK